MALNTWAVSILRYGAGILKWNKNELQEIDRKTRKLMTMNKELHSRSDVVRSYVLWKNGGRGIIGCENSVKKEENSLGWYVKNNIEPSLVAVRTSRTKKNEETVDPKEFKKTKEEQTKNEWTAKRKDGQFARDMEDKDKNNTCTISSTILTKLPSHRFVGCVVQEMRLYLMMSACGTLFQKEYQLTHDSLEDMYTFSFMRS